MDAVDYSEEAFNSILATYLPFARQLGMENVVGIPVSALKGDNILQASPAMPWYHGPALMQHLESVEVEQRAAHSPFRLPVQWVNRPSPDFRGFAGQIAAGRVNVGDLIRSLPSGHEARVARIVTHDGDLPHAVAGQSITLTLDREIDVSRGDLIATSAEPAEVSDQFEATLIWMHEQPMLPGRQYLMKVGTRTVNATLAVPRYRTNVNTLEQQPAQQLDLNEIGLCQLTLDRPVAFDPYARNRETGGFILIDKLSNDTVGAGLLEVALRRADNIHWQALDVTRAGRAQLKGQRACALWFTGLSGAGKSTVANLVEKRLHALGRHTYLLDGDNVRHGLNKDLGFSDADRVENIRRVAEVTRLMVDAGLIVLVSFISPFRSERQMARGLLGDGEFLEIFVDTPLVEAEKRDPKGLYRKARRGEIPNFTGIDSPYEAPENPEIRIDTTSMSAAQAAERIIAELDKAGVIAYAYNNPLAGL
jgi:bifunctional enzyme CysN/CysC